MESEKSEKIASASASVVWRSHSLGVSRLGKTFMAQNRFVVLDRGKRLIEMVEQRSPGLILWRLAKPYGMVF